MNSYERIHSIITESFPPEGMSDKLRAQADAGETHQAARKKAGKPLLSQYSKFHQKELENRKPGFVSRMRRVLKAIKTPTVMSRVRGATRNPHLPRGLR